MFDRDGTEYKIETRRGSTQTVKLYKNGQDISAHTATATYKIVEEVIGIDHKTFSQIVYQSNASSLEFLTAADTARKKFLIEILNLGRYTKAQEVFKEVAQELSKDITATQSQVNTVVAWLDKYSKVDLTPKQPVEVPELDSQALQNAAKLEVAIQGIESTNRKISQNNTYKQVQSKLTLLPLPEKPEEDVTVKQTIVNQLNTTAIELQKTIKDAEAFVQKMNKLHGNCPTCLQTIDTNKITELVSEQDNIKQSAKDKLEVAQQSRKEINNDLTLHAQKVVAWQQAQQSQADWEKYHQLIDTDLPEAVLDKDTLQLELNALQASIETTRTRIQAAEKQIKQLVLTIPK